MNNKTFLRFYNPSFILQKKLRAEALGTYLHSLTVGQMAFFAAEKLKGVDEKAVLLAGIYHDIGKIYKADNFLENKEEGESRAVSEEIGKIIAEHPQKGEKLAIRYRLPKEIQRFILSHHGDSFPLGEKKNKKVYKKAYRYRGPKPMKKDEALIMLADSCEAAARGLDEADFSLERLNELIHKVFDQKRAENQLNLVKLTKEEEDVIIARFAEFLSNFYHRR